MNIQCPKCSEPYVVASKHGGRLGYCHQCKHEFVLPIPNPVRLLKWAETTSWKRLFRFIRCSAARGHSEDTVSKLVQIYERRRWVEEAHVQYEMAQAKGQQVLSNREKIWAKSEKHLHRLRAIDELQKINHNEFERIIAELFVVQGYDARTVSRAENAGFDVDILTRDGEQWAIAQCKRYNENNRVSVEQVRSFYGAFMLSGAKQGFFFTTGLFTRQARHIAKEFSWLTALDGPQLIKYMEDINSEAEL